MSPRFRGGSVWVREDRFTSGLLPKGYCWLVLADLLLAAGGLDLLGRSPGLQHHRQDGDDRDDGQRQDEQETGVVAGLEVGLDVLTLGESDDERLRRDAPGRGRPHLLDGHHRDRVDAERVLVLHVDDYRRVALPLDGATQDEVRDHEVGVVRVVGDVHRDQRRHVRAGVVEPGLEGDLRGGAEVLLLGRELVVATEHAGDSPDGQDGHCDEHDDQHERPQEALGRLDFRLLGHKDHLPFGLKDLLSPS